MTSDSPTDRESIARLLLSQERLGQELHDVVGPKIAAAAMMAMALCQGLKNRGLPEEAMARKLLNCIEQAKMDVRRAAKRLIPVALDDYGLMSALEELAENTCQKHSVSCVLHCPEPVLSDDQFVTTRLYRVAREAMANAVQHAQASSIQIRLTRNGNIRLEITDDGCGIREDWEQGDGMGLRMTRQRCQIIGGTLTIERRPTGGTMVLCIVAAGENV